MNQYESRFAIGDKVLINGDLTLVVTVQRLMFASHGHTVEVSWFNSAGDYKEHWVFEWQLSHAQFEGLKEFEADMRAKQQSL